MVVGVGEDGVMAFTDDGSRTSKSDRNPQDDPASSRNAASVATMIKPKTEESDEV